MLKILDGAAPDAEAEASSSRTRSLSLNSAVSASSLLNPFKTPPFRPRSLLQVSTSLLSPTSHTPLDSPRNLNIKLNILEPILELWGQNLPRHELYLGSASILPTTYAPQPNIEICFKFFDCMLDAEMLSDLERWYIVTSHFDFLITFLSSAVGDFITENLKFNAKEHGIRASRFFKDCNPTVLIEFLNKLAEFIESKVTYKKHTKFMRYEILAIHMDSKLNGYYRVDDLKRLMFTFVNLEVENAPHMRRFGRIAKQLIVLADGAHVTDENGRTPLHWLVNRKYTTQRDENICQFLLKAGADCLLKDHEGKSPLDLVIDDGTSNILRLMLSSDFKFETAALEQQLYKVMTKDEKFTFGDIAHGNKENSESMRKVLWLVERLAQDDMWHNFALVINGKSLFDLPLFNDLQKVNHRNYAYISSQAADREDERKKSKLRKIITVMCMYASTKAVLNVIALNHKHLFNLFISSMMLDIAYNYNQTVLLDQDRSPSLLAHNALHYIAENPWVTDIAGKYIACDRSKFILNHKSYALALYSSNYTDNLSPLDKAVANDNVAFLSFVIKNVKTATFDDTYFIRLAQKLAESMFKIANRDGGMAKIKPLIDYVLNNLHSNSTYGFMHTLSQVCVVIRDIPENASTTEILDMIITKHKTKLHMLITIMLHSINRSDFHVGFDDDCSQQSLEHNVLHYLALHPELIDSEFDDIAPLVLETDSEDAGSESSQTLSPNFQQSLSTSSPESQLSSQSAITPRLTLFKGLANHVHRLAQQQKQQKEQAQQLTTGARSAEKIERESQDLPEDAEALSSPSFSLI